MIPLVERGGWNRVMQWSALLGFGLIFGGRYFADLPFSVYAQSEFLAEQPCAGGVQAGNRSVTGRVRVPVVRVSGAATGAGCGQLGRPHCWSTGCTWI